MRRHTPLVAVLLLYLSCAGLWYLALPPIEGPDENGHHDYIRYLATFRRLPSELPPPGWNPNCWWHPPLYYAALAPILAARGTDNARIVTPVFNESRQLFGYYRVFLFDGPVTRPIETLYWLRLASAAFGLATVWLAFVALEFLLGSARQAGLVTSGLVLVPQFTSLSVSVTNDTLVTTLSALAVVLLLRLMRRGSTAPAVFVCGVVVGLAIVTKLNALCLVPMAAVGITLGDRRPSRTAGHLLLFGAGVTITSGWYFVRNWVLFGDPMGAAFKLQTMNSPEVQAQTHQWFDPYFVSVFPREILSTFWARFGWVAIPASRPVMALYAAVTLALLVAIGLYLRRVVRRSTVPAREREVAWTFVAGVASAVVMFVGLNLAWFAAQARLLYPALVPLLGLAAMGVRSLARDAQRWIPRPVMAVAVSLWLVAMAAAWLLTWRWALIALFAV